MIDSYEWDDVKNASNYKKHGIRFEEAIQIFEGPVLTLGQFHGESGEYRELSFGLIGEMAILAVVHTDRNGKTRIISARKALKKERRAFYENIKRSLR